jgi:glycosyltransferase involved in cell wall biosynthesis
MRDTSADISNDGRTAVFTIVSRNYFHFAVNLMASVKQHLPGARRVVAICDALDGLVSPDPEIELVGAEDLGIPGLDRMATYYTILELNTAIKPSVFQWLLRDAALDKVIYFDPDIELFSSGQPLVDRLDSADVVLTPHLLAPLDDDRHPSDLQILQSGTYNLGFLALRRSAQTQRLLQWWAAKLVRDCVVDIPRGLFTDQKWMDLIPGFFERVHIERHPGWNVAYWNLAHRQVEADGAGWRVNGQPLFFFHFSGFDPKSGSISKHQDRFAMADCNAAVQQLFAHYDRQLARAGREQYAKLPYAYARLGDGSPLPDCARRVLRLQLDWNQDLPDLRSPAGARWLVDFLTAPVDAHQPAISRLALQLYQDRDDLRMAFPDMLQVRREAFLAWFADRAGPEAGVVGVLATVSGPAAPAPTPAPAAAPPAVVEAAARPPAAALPAALPAAAPVAPAGAPAPAVVHPYRLAYRLAYKARHLIRPMTSLEFRARARTALLNRAFPAQAAPVAPAAAPTADVNAEARARHPEGITVIGYVKAESGVGESARATLRALATTGIAHSLVDFRTGNVSRMAEAVDESLATGTQHAVSLFHINADQLPIARTFLGEAPFTGTYRIGFWAWELENFPTQWHGAFAHVDEVWVPSSFCQRAIAAVSPVPVVVMPHAVEIPQRLAPDRARFGLPADAVVFLAMADMMSIAGRKNPFAAVQAFVDAFGTAPPSDGPAPVLVVKIANAQRDANAHAKLLAMAASCPGIRLLAESLDRADLNTLLDSVDCFISLHRSEGFGLVMAETMARGKVVVATAWSGNMDFMNAANSLPVDYRLVPLEEDHGPYARGERWADPDLADAAAKMRRVAADPELRQRLGQRARADCAAQLAPEVVGAAQQARLRAILLRQA